MATTHIKIPSKRRYNTSTQCNMHQKCCCCCCLNDLHHNNKNNLNAKENYHHGNTNSNNNNSNYILHRYLNSKYQQQKGNCILKYKKKYIV